MNRISLREDVLINGVNIFNGKPNSALIRPSAYEGLRFLVDGDEIPVSLERAFIHRPLRTLKLAKCIGIRGERKVVKKVEHFLAALYALGIDDAIIELSDDTCPRLDYGVSGIVNLLDSKRKLNKGGKKYLSLKRNEKIEGRSSIGNATVDLHEAASTFIDYRIYRPYEAVLRQYYKFEFNEVNFKREIMHARGIIYLPFGSRNLYAYLGRFFGATDRNSLFIGGKEDKNFANQTSEGYYGNQEYVRHQIMDVVGTLALSGAYFKGVGFNFSQGDHDFELEAVKELFRRKVFKEVKE